MVNSQTQASLDLATLPVEKPRPRPAALPPMVLASYEDLLDALARRERTCVWHRRLRHPLYYLLQNFGRRRAFPWQRDFLGYPGWTQELRRRLRQLPSGFITNYSLQPDAAHYLHCLAKSGEYSCIMECGSGVSTVLMALGMKPDLTRLVSLEHDEHWRDCTWQALEKSGLTQRTELVHAPLTPVSRDGSIYLAHEFRKAYGLQVDFLFIDAPPGRIGRQGTLPRLRQHLQRGALVVLDDAARMDEQECVRTWVREGFVRFRGYVAVGRGLAIMEAR